MSVSTEVQRTLVKSPPELWTELSNAEGLTRHLGEVGEIRVTKVEPETRVEWEADQVSGVVELEQSGWGTKVTLSLTRAAQELELEVELAVEPEPASPESESLAPALDQIDPQPEAPTAEPESIVVREVRPEPEPVAEIVEPEPGARVGFFARLFKRRSYPPAASAPEPVAGSEPSREPEIQALSQPEPVYPPAPIKPVEPAEPAADPGTELAEIEARMQRESTELLTAVLDRLGAAHHRPFSRA